MLKNLSVCLPQNDYQGPASENVDVVDGLSSNIGQGMDECIIQGRSSSSVKT